MSIFSNLATSLKAKADALDTEISSAFAAQAAADEAHVEAKTKSYEDARAARIVENDQKIADKNSAFAAEKAAKEAELAALIGLPTDPGDKDLTDGATVLGAINQLAIEYDGWNTYQINQYNAAIDALNGYESDVLGSAADFIAEVNFEA
jgi:hypothetical protein